MLPTKNPPNSTSSSTN